MAKPYRWIHSKPLCRPNPSHQGGLILPGPNSQTNFIRQGEVFVPTSAELQAFRDRIEEIKEGDKEK